MIARPEHHSVPIYNSYDEYRRQYSFRNVRPLTLIAKRYTPAGRRAMVIRLWFPIYGEKPAKLVQLLRHRPELGAHIRRIEVSWEPWRRVQSPGETTPLEALSGVLPVATGLRAFVLEHSSFEETIDVLGVLSEHMAGGRLAMLSLPLCDSSEQVSANSAARFAELVAKLNPRELRWKRRGWRPIVETARMLRGLAEGREMAVDGGLSDADVAQIPDEWAVCITQMSLGLHEYGGASRKPLFGRFSHLRRLDLGGHPFQRATLDSLPPTLEALEIGHPGTTDMSAHTFRRDGSLGALADCLANYEWCPLLNELVVDLGSVDEYVPDGAEEYERYEMIYGTAADSAVVKDTGAAITRHAQRRGIYIWYMPPSEYGSDETEYLEELNERM